MWSAWKTATVASSVAGALLLAACGEPKSSPTVVPPGTFDRPAEDPPAEPPEPTARDVEKTGDDPTVIVIGGPQRAPEEPPPGSLFEASQRARDKRSESDSRPPIAVVTDDTLHEFATGDLTVAEARPEAAGDKDTGVEEATWRRRILDARLDWREALDRVEELRSEIADLRRQFYEADDGYYRDSEIKPRWDQAIQALSDAERDALAREDSVSRILAEGRAAGALPGWLREGIDLEPERRRPDSDETAPTDHQSQEPVEVEGGR